MVMEYALWIVGGLVIIVFVVYPILTGLGIIPKEFGK